MFRFARFLIAALLLATGHVVLAQQNDAAALSQPTPPPAPDPVAGADSLIPPAQGAPTPGPESLTRAGSTSAPKASPKSGGAPSLEPVSKSEVRAISVQPPPSDSPFFIERQEARDAAAKAGREGYGMYVPKPPRPPALQQIKTFFQGFFGHGKKKGAAGGPAPMTLTVDPTDFSLAQTSELDVSLKISNARKQEIELLFPDNQRLEILTKDSSGNVVGRWSEDRAFDRQEGFTEINPAESVIYAERIPTSKMKANQTYTIEASLANQEGYTTSKTVKPRP
jgi:Intracellular proteinase inhibitor